MVGILACPDTECCLSFCAIVYCSVQYIVMIVTPSQLWTFLPQLCCIINAILYGTPYRSSVFGVLCP